MKFHSHRYGIPTAIARDKIVIKLLDSIWPIDFTTSRNGEIICQNVFTGLRHLHKIGDTDHTVNIYISYTTTAIQLEFVKAMTRLAFYT